MGSIARGMFAATCALLVAAGVACGGTATTDTITPITGITVRSETLTTGLGCGTAPGQIFKYVAVVRGWDRAANAGFDPHSPASFGLFVTAAIYDCFTDATFVQLPSINDSFTYRFELYAYDQPSYAAAAAEIGNAVNRIDPLYGDVYNADRQRDANDADAKLAATGPMLTTTCSATQQQDVDVLAACDVVQRGLGGIAGLDGGLADAGVATDAGGDGDAAGGADGDAGADAGD